MSVIKQHGTGDRPASDLSSDLWSTPQVQEAVAVAFLRENAEELTEIELSGPDQGRVATGTIVQAELPTGTRQGRLSSLTRAFSRSDGFSATAEYMIECRKS